MSDDLLDSFLDDDDDETVDAPSASSDTTRELAEVVGDASEPTERERISYVHESDAGREDVDDPMFTASEMEVKPEQARAVLNRIYEQVEKREQQGHRVREIVLGLPQYKLLEPWAHAEYGDGIDEVLDHLEIIVVPGPVIHPVIPNRWLLEEDMNDG